MVRGQGYAPGETVNFSINGAKGGQATADGSGNFANCSFIIPNLASGTYQLHGIGRSSGADAVYYFYIGGFYPSAGPDNYYLLPGDTLTFSGSGFAAGETVSILYNGSQVGSFTVPNSGSFSAAGGVVIDNSLAGGVRIFHLHSSVTGADIALMVTIGTFNGAVSPSSYYLLPGQTLSFSGSGFAPGEAVKVFLGNNSAPLETFSADSSGGFSGAGGFVIASNLAGTTQHVIVKGASSNTQAALDIAVQGFYAQLTPSAYFVLPGQHFTVAGSGFGSHETVQLTLNGGGTVSTTTDAGGAFTAAGPFTAPFSANSLHIQASGMSSGASAAVDITLGGLYPTVNPSMWYALPGSSIIFTGSGFAPNEGIAVAAAGSSTAITADSSGGFTTGGMLVPFSSKPLVYTFTGNLSHAATNVTITVASLAPVVTADNYYVTPGSTVHISALGFMPHESITITAGSVQVQATADAFGNASSTAIVLPVTASGTVVITATGAASGAAGQTSVTLAPFYPQVTPSTWYTSPGTNASFTGSGFAPHESVGVSLNGNAVASTTADGSGAFTSGQVTIPVTAHAAHFVFTGAVSGATASTDIGLSGFSPQLVPSTWYAAPGSAIIFSGSGFAPGETVSETYNGVTATITAGSDGTVTTTPVSVPYSATAAAFSFSSSVTHVTTQFTIGVAALSPSIWLSTYYDYGGKPLTVFGGGFAAGETVHLTFDGAVLGDATTDSGGNLTWATTVPFGAAGNKTIQARGQSSGVTANASFTQPQVYVNVQLGSYAGAPGTAVNFIGSGFLPHEPVAITTDRTGSAAVTTIAADASGNFNDSGWQVPTGFTGGSLTLTVTGTHSFVSKSIVYYVTGP